MAKNPVTTQTDSKTKSSSEDSEHLESLDETNETEEQVAANDFANAEAKTAQTDFITDMAANEDEPELDENAFETEGEAVTRKSTQAPAQSDETSKAKTEADEGEKVEGQEPPPAKTDEQKKADEEVDKSKSPEEKAREETAAVKQEEKIETPVQAATPEQMQEYYVKWRGETEDLLAKHHYALNQEQMDELDVNPGEFISKMMSKVYLDAVTATLTQITHHLPRMVQSINDQSIHTNKAEEVFYERWPKLKEHHASVLRMGAAYRQMNPNATQEDFINEVGAQTMVALRISPDEAAGTGATNGNGAGNGASATRARGFKPAVSTPPNSGAPSTKKNPFEQLAEEFEEEIENE